LPLTVSWGLGGMAAILVLTQMVTGSLLNFIYEPVPSLAYPSILIIHDDIVFGKLVRNLHHWGANLLVIVAGLHMLRVIFTAAFYAPRHVTWYLGLGLMALVLGANFSGYLLPYDQLAYWAVTICTGMLDYIPWLGPYLKALIMAGEEIGPAALKLFHTVHTTVVPALFLFLMTYHFWRIRKAGGLVVPKQPEDPPTGTPLRVPTVPNLIVREMAMTAVILAVLLVLAVFFDAPLGEPANPGLSPNPTKAPWYFAGLQELLLHFPPVLAVTVIPFLAGLLLLALPFASQPNEAASIWFGTRPDRIAAGAAAIGGVIVTLLWVFLNEYFRTEGWHASGIHRVFSGEIAFGLGLAGLAGFFFILRRRVDLSRHGAFQAVLMLLTSVFLTLTIIGAGFRGAGMRLTWPGG